jgi:hypothetical protein
MATARKKEKKCGASSRHITNPKQFIFSFDIWNGQIKIFSSAVEITFRSDLRNTSKWVKICNNDSYIRLVFNYIFHQQTWSHCSFD